MATQIRRIFIVEDRYGRDLEENLKPFFPDADIESFESMRPLNRVLEEGCYPQAVFLDATYEDGHEFWGRDNAELITGWFKKHAPEHVPPYFLFMSADSDRAIRSARVLKDVPGVQTFALDKGEIRLAESLAQGELASDDFIRTTGFRRFLKEASDLALPMTEEEMIAYKIRLQKYKPDDLVRFVRNGKFGRDEALRLIYAEAMDAAAADFIPTAVVFSRDDYDKVDKLRCSFNQMAGQSATGYAAFSLADVRRLAKEDKKAVLFMKRYSPKFIPHLSNISGVVLLSPNSSGHMRLMLNAHGTAGALGAEDIGKLHPYLRTQEGCKIRYGKVITGSGRNRIFIDFEKAADEQGWKHQTRHRGIDRKDRIPSRTVDIAKLKPVTKIRFGDPVTVDVSNRDGSAEVYPLHLEIKEKTRGIDVRKWLPEAGRLLADWQKDNGVQPLVFKAIADHSGHFYNEASGIGLLRTEHFILASEKQTGAFRKAVLTRDEAALDILRAEFRETLADGLRCYDYEEAGAVRVRLADLPPREVFSAKERARIGELYGDADIRGVQLAMRLPQLYEAQLRAVFGAYNDAMKSIAESWEGNPPVSAKPKLEIMVPTVRTAEELVFVKAMTQRIAAEHGVKEEDYRFGSMLETVEAGVHIEEIAPHCDFLSIGSNDASSEILGYERHNYEQRHKVMLQYGERFDPSITLYPPVIEWIKDTARRARGVKPEIQIDLCGDHGADLDSLNALRPVKLDAVSVTPTRHNLIGLKLRYDYGTFMEAQKSAPDHKADTQPTPVNL